MKKPITNNIITILSHWYSSRASTTPIETTFGFFYDLTCRIPTASIISE